jgi:hypothetical protein
MKITNNNQSQNNTIRNSYNDVPFQKHSSNCSCSTNTKWVIGILVLTVILLTTWILTNYIKDGNNLVNLLVNFSTLLSIVLSVSSIAFAGYTSIETGRQYYNMAKAVEEIRTTNGIMSENYKNLMEHYHETVKLFSQILEGYANNAASSNRVSDIPPTDISNEATIVTDKAMNVNQS